MLRLLNVLSVWQMTHWIEIFQVVSYLTVSYKKGDLRALALALSISDKGTNSELLSRIDDCFHAKPDLKINSRFSGLFSKQRKTSDHWPGTQRHAHGPQSRQQLSHTPATQTNAIAASHDSPSYQHPAIRPIPIPSYVPTTTGLSHVSNPFPPSYNHPQINYLHNASHIPPAYPNSSSHMLRTALPHQYYIPHSFGSHLSNPQS